MHGNMNVKFVYSLLQGVIALQQLSVHGISSPFPLLHILRPSVLLGLLVISCFITSILLPEPYSSRHSSYHCKNSRDSTRDVTTLITLIYPSRS